VFRSETGVSPAKAVENPRLEAAQLMLEQSRLPLDIVAKEVDFGSCERMRRAFVRAYGEPRLKRSGTMPGLSPPSSVAPVEDVVKRWIYDVVCGGHQG